MATQTILELTKRLDSIEILINKPLDYNYDKIAVIISLFSLAVSIWAILSASRSSDKSDNITVTNNLETLLNTIKNNIDESKKHYESLSMEMAELKAKNQKTPEENSELILKQQILDSAFEKVLNAYEDGCEKFYNNKISKKDFSGKYHLDINDYITNFPNKFREPETRYTYMLKYYKEYFKNPKVE